MIGDELTLEYYQAKSTKESPIINIAKVYYGYRDIPFSINSQNSLGYSGNCQVNINCSEGQNWRKEKNAIARIYVKLPNQAGWCSGSLVNNTANDNSPLFLTANHCLSTYFDAITNPNLSQWIFYWNYEFTGCNNENMEPHILSTVGAKLKANGKVSDFALFELTQDPRNLDNFTPYYLGWNCSGNAGIGGVGIHHPKGDVKKIATYSISPQNSYCANSNLYWDARFDMTLNGHSVMQPGSSGSPLINSNRHIIGQLYGPYNKNRCPTYQCDNPSEQNVAYGKFSVSWTGNGASDNRRKLQPWLDPLNTGQQVLNGKAFTIPRDLIVRDDKNDDGYEPNLSFVSWASPDIWLTDKYNRRVYTAPVYSDNFHRVAVRIKNRGTEPVEGAKLFVHWTANTFNSKWVNSWIDESVFGLQSNLPYTFPWTYIPKGGAITPQEGIDIPTIQPNEDTIVYVPWDMSFYDVCHLFFGKHFNDLERFDWGFSLLAAIDDGNDYPLYLVNYPTTMFAKSYNNVATHNARAWLIGEHYTQILPFDSIITSPFVISYSQIENEGHVLNDFAEVYAILSNDMIRNLNFENSKGIKQVSENRVILTSPEAELHFYGADGEAAFYAVGAQVNFISDKVPQLNDFDFEITLHATDEQSTPYTETRRMTAVRNQDIYFKAVAEADKDKVVRNKEYVVLNSNVLMDSASYVWFDQSGSKIGEGSQITVSPQTSQVYTVSITKDEDGYRSYGEIEVEALDGVIKSLSPNPANDNVTVVYELSDNVANASIRISNIEQTITTDHTIVPTATSQTIPLSGYSSGVYMVKLVIDGVVVDSKQLIIY